MGAETSNGGQLTEDISGSAGSIEILKSPVIQVNDGAALKIVAVERFTDESIPARPVGFVSTTHGKSEMLAEFSGKPTGTYSPVNAVVGFVGGNEIYRKQVTTDLPLSGLRTVLAQRRAVKRVKTRLKP